MKGKTKFDYGYGKYRAWCKKNPFFLNLEKKQNSGGACFSCFSDPQTIQNENFSNNRLSMFFFTCLVSGNPGKKVLTTYGGGGFTVF